MNRFIQATLLVSISIFPAIGQEPDSVTVVRQTDSAVSFEQTDSIASLEQTDSVYSPGEPDFSHSPSKAIMYALVLPGLGQAYNGKYYKMPIVWAALGVAGYAISYNTKQYREASLNYALEQNRETQFYLDAWRRNMELSYISLIAVYALQILDAYVDAYLYSWDVNENLSFRVVPSLKPIMTPAGFTGQSCGLTCSLNIRNR